MKKLLTYGLVGAMFVASQSMIFAGVTPNTQEGEQIKATQLTKGYKIEDRKDLGKINKADEDKLLSVEITALADVFKDGEVGDLSSVLTTSTQAIELTEEERAELIKAEKERIQKMCEVLGWEYEIVENKTMCELISTLTDAQIDQLVEASVIQVMEISTTVEAEKVIEK